MIISYNIIEYDILKTVDGALNLALDGMAGPVTVIYALFGYKK
jgi:hypothetical protein